MTCRGQKISKKKTSIKCCTSTGSVVFQEAVTFDVPQHIVEEISPVPVRRQTHGYPPGRRRSHRGRNLARRQRPSSPQVGLWCLHRLGFFSEILGNLKSTWDTENFLKKMSEFFLLAVSHPSDWNVPCNFKIYVNMHIILPDCLTVTAHAHKKSKVLSGVNLNIKFDIAFYFLNYKHFDEQMW